MKAKQPKGLAATDLKKDRVYRCIVAGNGFRRGDAAMVYDGFIFPGRSPCGGFVFPGGTPCAEVAARFALDESVRDAKAGIAMRKANKIRAQKA